MEALDFGAVAAAADVRARRMRTNARREFARDPDAEARRIALIPPVWRAGREAEHAAGMRRMVEEATRDAVRALHPKRVFPRALRPPDRAYLDTPPPKPKPPALYRQGRAAKYDILEFDEELPRPLEYGAADYGYADAERLDARDLPGWINFELLAERAEVRRRHARVMEQLLRSFVLRAVRLEPGLRAFRRLALGIRDFYAADGWGWDADADAEWELVSN